jgi:HPt (histidine-containing phosphotransfer) domain-containing protein
MVTVTHRPGLTWSQVDLGEDFDVFTLSVIGGLDPDGEARVVEEILGLFLDSLEPALVTIERLRAARSSVGILAEAERLKAAADEIGAQRLSDACFTAVNSFHIGTRTGAVFANAALDTVVEDLVTEIIRAQRKLRRLLAD